MNFEIQNGIFKSNKKIKPSIKCPSCGARLMTYHVPITGYMSYNPTTGKLGKTINISPSDTTGFCPKCGENISIDLFEVIQ